MATTIYKNQNYPTVRRGMTGNDPEAVKALQRLLHLMPDGVFGRLTEEAVREFQRAHGLTADGICGPKTWAALIESGATQIGQPSEDGSLDISKIIPVRRRTITDIIIHCSATPEGRDYTAADIRKWHKAKGWSDIGYHYVVLRNGKIETGRNQEIAGAHCEGYNAHSIGIVYIGGMDAANKQAADTRTEAQRKSLLALVRRLHQLYPQAKIKGHREYSPDKNGNGVIEQWEWMKDCPSFEVSELRREVNEPLKRRY